MLSVYSFGVTGERGDAGDSDDVSELSPAWNETRCLPRRPPARGDGSVGAGLAGGAGLTGGAGLMGGGGAATSAGGSAAGSGSGSSATVSSAVGSAAPSSPASSSGDSGGSSSCAASVATSRSRRNRWRAWNPRRIAWMRVAAECWCLNALDSCFSASIAFSSALAASACAAKASERRPLTSVRAILPRQTACTRMAARSIFRRSSSRFARSLRVYCCTTLAAALSFAVCFVSRSRSLNLFCTIDMRIACCHLRCTRPRVKTRATRFFSTVEEIACFHRLRLLTLPKSLLEKDTMRKALRHLRARPIRSDMRSAAERHTESLRAGAPLGSSLGDVVSSSPSSPSSPAK
mmetsp:Transcript_9350/g.32501  ORF Transcript_9350/g.32501 Transcript_9350/m.32501 type:complete len:348 (+) Transcript_9350:375-1418(+)